MTTRNSRSGCDSKSSGTSCFMAVSNRSASASPHGRKSTIRLRASSLFLSPAHSSFRTAAAFAYSSSVLLPRFSAATAICIPTSVCVTSLPLKRVLAIRILCGGRVWMFRFVLHLQVSVRTNTIVFQPADHLASLIWRGIGSKSHAAKLFESMICI